MRRLQSQTLYFYYFLLQIMGINAVKNYNITHVQILFFLFF